MYSRQHDTNGFEKGRVTVSRETSNRKEVPLSRFEALADTFSVAVVTWAFQRLYTKCKLKERAGMLPLEVPEARQGFQDA